MPRRLMRWLPVLFAVLLLAGCTQKLEGSGPIRVAVSIPPLADMARQIGGERVTVAQLVPPGASVHTYEPTPRQVEFVSTANLLILNGVNLEFWAPKVIEAANNPRLVVVDTAEGLPLLQAAGEQGGNPHVWLSPGNAARQAERIRDALIRVDPDHEATYRGNAERYLAALRTLDQEILAETKEWRHRDFVAFHPAWAYFAERYGLRQVGVIEEFPGKEPSPEYLARLVETIKQSGVPVVFAEPQFPPRAAEAVAGEAKVKVIVLDPLGGVKGRETYLELMQYNVGRMRQGLE